jgi:recombination protein RecR
MQYALPITRLIKAFSRLPGIGEKSASRLALFLLNSRRELSEELSKSLIDAKDLVRLCKVCMTFSEGELCEICSDFSRDESVICVVGDYKDMIALENSSGAKRPYAGCYHILHGLLAPLKGVGPDEIRIRELMARITDNKDKGKVSEVILATSFDSEGDSTAMYISKLIKPLGVRVTRIASGVPVGGSIEYMDSTTLERAMAGRIEF